MSTLNRRGFLHALSLAPAALAIPNLATTTRSGVIVPPEYRDRLPLINALEAELAHLGKRDMWRRGQAILHELRLLYLAFDEEASYRCFDAILAFNGLHQNPLNILAEGHLDAGRLEQAYDILRVKSIRFYHLPNLWAAAHIRMALLTEDLRPAEAAENYRRLLASLEARAQESPSLERLGVIVQHFAEVQHRRESAGLYHTAH